MRIRCEHRSDYLRSRGVDEPAGPWTFTAEPWIPVRSQRCSADHLLSSYQTGPIRERSSRTVESIHRAGRKARRVGMVLELQLFAYQELFGLGIVGRRRRARWIAMRWE